MSKLKIMGGHGGYRPGAGRPKGAKDRKPRAPRWDSRLMRDIEAAAYDDPEAPVIVLSPKNPLALAVVIGLAACADQQSPFDLEVTGPEVLAPFFSEQPADGFTVLRRTKPLSRSVSVTQTVGAKGGKIKLKGAGLTLDIPKGALGGNTVITITAPAGNVVAFTFSPHGLSFGKPASILLDVKGTTAEGTDGSDTYSGVYFVGDVSGPVEPLEVLQTSFDGKRIIFAIEHFSGYAVAGGRSGKANTEDESPRRKKSKKGR